MTTVNWRRNAGWLALIVGVGLAAQLLSDKAMVNDTTLLVGLGGLTLLAVAGWLFWSSPPKQPSPSESTSEITSMDQSSTGDTLENESHFWPRLIGQVCLGLGSLATLALVVAAWRGETIKSAVIGPILLFKGWLLLRLYPSDRVTFTRYWWYRLTGR